MRHFYIGQLRHYHIGVTQKKMTIDMGRDCMLYIKYSVSNKDTRVKPRVSFIAY